MKTLSEIEEPWTVRDVQSLAVKIATLGRFISKMLDRWKTILKSIKQSISLEWGKEHSKEFKELKKYLSSAPILLAPEDGEELFLYLILSDVEVSAILVREENKRKKQVLYMSKMLLDAETNYTNLEKMVLTLVMAKKTLRHYFESHPIKVMRNHPIQQILSKPNLSRRLTRWAIELGIYGIKYAMRTMKKGQVVVDFLVEIQSFKPMEMEMMVLLEEGMIWTLTS